MNNMIAIIPVAAAAYVATNLDNLILLVALLARYRKHTANVIAGFFASTLILVLVGMWIGKAANIDRFYWVAGRMLRGQFAEHSSEDVEKTIDVNFRTSALVVQDVFRRMTKSETSARFVAIARSSSSSRVSTSRGRFRLVTSSRSTRRAH